MFFLYDGNEKRFPPTGEPGEEAAVLYLSFAPMEGVTGADFRRVHRRMFPGADRYYAPFVSPDAAGNIKRGQLDALRRGADGSLVPQVLTNSAAVFCAAAVQLADLGYAEINLNAGCPSGTVTAKGKGAALLADRDALCRLLDGIFAAPAAAVSVKTRMGWAGTEEFAALLEVYNRYPLAELIIHARDRAGMYRSRPDAEGFALALRESRCPVCYNGDVFSPADLERLGGKLGGLDRVMLGRGAAADPALFRLLRGGEPLEAEELRAFLDALWEGALAAGLGPAHALARMKELWYYLRWKFPGGEKLVKKLLKSRRAEDYRDALDALFDSGAFDPLAFFRQPPDDMPVSF